MPVPPVVAYQLNFWTHAVKLDGLNWQIITQLSLCPPFGKGGSGGIWEVVENPPKEAVRKCHSEA